MDIIKNEILFSKKGILTKEKIDVMNLILLEEKDLSGDILVRKIDDLINNDDKIINIKKNLRKLKVDNSASLIYEEIKKLTSETVGKK